MKKLNKFFAILFVALFASATAKADTSVLKESEGWHKITVMPSNLTDYYYALVDKDNDLMLTMAVGANQGNTYYTMYYRNSVNPLQNKAALWTIEGSNYTFRNAEYNTLAMQTEWNASWYYRTHDQPNPCEWTATIPAYSSSEACWTIQNGKYPDNRYLGPWSDVVNNGAEVAFNKSGNAIGKFHIYAIHKTYCKDVLAAKATPNAPVDMTVLLANVNADLPVVGLGGWTTANTIARNGNNGYDGKGGFFEFCNWGSTSGWNGSMSQTITSLPNGKYIVKAAGQAAVDVVLTMTANDESVTLNSKGDKGGSLGFQGWEYMEVTCAVTDGTLKISVESSAKTNAKWSNIDNFTLTYTGPDKTISEGIFNTNYTKLSALSTDCLPSAFANKINNLKAQYNVSATGLTLSELEEANAAMDAVISIYDAIKFVFTDLQDLITTCNTYASTDYSNVKDNAQRTKLTNAATTATTNGNNATTVAELTEVYNTLENERQEFVLVAYPTTGNSFDMTFKITNPSFETGDLTGWNILQYSSDTGVKKNSGDYATTGTHGNHLFNTWWKGVPIKQTLSDLPTGTYTMTVAVASDGCTVYLTADDEHNAGQMTSDKTVFIDTSIEFLCTDGETTIGVVGGDNGDAGAHKDFVAEGYWWYKADNFRLIRAFDASSLQNSLTVLKNKAANLLTKPMEPSKKSDLQTAYNNADATSDNPFELGDRSLALETAIAAAQSSVNDYLKIQEYINKTKVFVAESAVATYQTKHDNCEYTSADVESVRRELNVIRFNGASNVFTNKVDVTGWTGDLANGVRSDQHWSGETKEYYDANSWTPNFVGLKHTLSTTKTLPKGTYVLKAAGRSSEDATLSLIIKDGNTTIGNVEYTGKGDTGYGIDTKGNANFSAEGTYANDNKGRGWEWEFAKFELAKETTVTLHVEVDYNNNQNRFGSFSDITLWMDGDTYMNVYGEALEQPLTDAKALVNTLPMGVDENTALSDAIALGEGKITGPNELNAAVDALKNSVEKANNWRTKYYEEKAKLVEQLERFEADYNDAENGSIDYMNNDRWATVIEKAQAAAVAKDNQTSHAVLKTATNELTVALDAATVSVNEYAALKSVIGEANSLVVANVGDQPFEKPQSAADAINTTDEQALYDAATADGEGVTSVTDALNKGIEIFNNTPLNAPKDGARYNLVLNNNYGWTYDGKAVTYLVNDRPDMGLYNIQYWSAVNANYAQAFTFTAVDGQQDCYYISMTDVDGNERYVSTGVVYGGNANQIRTTTNAEDALAVKVIATKTDGVHNLYNVEASNYIGSQDNGFYTVNSHINFNILEASTVDVTLTISSAKWSTLILPFNAELPEGVKAYTCAGVIDGVLTFNEDTTIVANTPYLVGGNAGEYDFSGYGLADKDSYTIGESQASGLFTGTYVEYKTEADGKTWVLQKDKNTGSAVFLIVGTSVQPKVKANRCYITYEEVSGARMLRLGFGDDDTTGIDNMQFPTDNSRVTIYDTMGRKVTSMKKGNLYIMNGRKVVVK